MEGVMKKWLVTLSVAAVSAAFSISSYAADVPSDSPTVKRIQDRGSLKVGVLSQLPWVGENPSDPEDPWFGPTWMQAKLVADALKVKLAPVPVSHDTKVTAVQTGQVDITIAPLNETAARRKVIDFAINSIDGQCFVKLKDNDSINTVDDLKKPGIKVAIPLGGSQQQLIPPVYPEMEIKPQVLPPGVNWATAATLNRTTDVTIFPSAQVFLLLKAHPDKFTVIPEPDQCLADPLLPIDTGWGFQKGDPAFVAFVQDILDSSRDEFDEQFQQMVRELGK